VMCNATTNIFEGLHGEEVLVRRDTSLPETVKTEDQPGLGEWKLVSDLTSEQFDKELYKAGWQFFYIPPETRASAVGFNRKQALEKALKKLLAKAHAAKLNAVQLTGVEAKKFLGIHYASVSAYLRHVQKSLILSPASEKTEERRLSRAA
jgi:hypothetical protein